MCFTKIYSIKENTENTFNIEVNTNIFHEVKMCFDSSVVGRF